MSKGRQAAIERIRHMLAATETIGRYVERGRAAFDSDPAIRDAIVYQIVVVGEAAKAVVSADPSMESELPGVEWSLLAKMRDKVTHQYWAVDAEVVWSTSELDVPQIRDLLKSTLGRLDP